MRNALLHFVTIQFMADKDLAETSTDRKVSLHTKLNGQFDVTAEGKVVDCHRMAIAERPRTTLNDPKTIPNDPQTTPERPLNEIPTILERPPNELLGSAAACGGLNKKLARRVVA